MRGWLDRHRLVDRLDAQVIARKVGDIRQLLFQHLRAQVPQVKVDVILAIDAVALTNLFDDAARDDIARSQVFERWHVAFHEVLAFAIQDLRALTARTFTQQHANFVEAGGMELIHLHVLQRNATAIGN